MAATVEKGLCGRGCGRGRGRAAREAPAYPPAALAPNQAPFTDVPAAPVQADSATIAAATSKAGGGNQTPTARTTKQVVQGLQMSGAPLAQPVVPVQEFVVPTMLDDEQRHLERGRAAREAPAYPPAALAPNQAPFTDVPAAPVQADSATIAAATSKAGGGNQTPTARTTKQVVQGLQMSGAPLAQPVVPVQEFVVPTMLDDEQRHLERFGRL
uniref:Nischarin-like n=1 Tax=Nicotiana sylvestris TaxID=4096 RepID=A0A1U7WFT3_NICSY|nr:PREDICTED: nischarin-like [Nicotiana sylvestris]